MSEDRRPAVVQFVDKRRAGAPEGAGVIEVIYELDNDPETLRALTLPRNEVPEGLRKGSKVLVTFAGDRATAVSARTDD